MTSDLTKSWQSKAMADVRLAAQEKEIVEKSQLLSQLQSALSSLQESHTILQSLLKSKDDTIKVLRAQCKGIVPSYQVQREMIQHLLTQELKEGDEW